MSVDNLTREQIIADLKLRKPEFAKRFGVERLGLFGSFARNDASPKSDVDIVVQFADPDLFALVHIKEALESDFNRSVDIINYSTSMNGFLKSRIAQEAVYV